MGGAAGESGARYLRLLREAAPEIKRRFGVRSIGLFGSAARGEAGPDSDVDVLVEIEGADVRSLHGPQVPPRGPLRQALRSRSLADSLKEGVRQAALSEVVYA